VADTPHVKRVPASRLARWLRPRHWLPLAAVLSAWFLLDFALARMAEDSRNIQPHAALHPAVGEVFSDLSSLRERQQAAGFELLGLLDVHFPVRVLVVRQAPGEIALTRADGTQRLYRGGRGQLLEAMSVAGADAGRGWIVWRRLSAGDGTRVSLR